MNEPPGRGAIAGNSRLPSLGPRGEGWFALQLLLIAAIAAAGIFSGSPWSDGIRMMMVVAGSALIGAGIVLGFAAIRDLDRSLSPLPRPPDDAVLVTSGVYGRILHPIYAALTMLALGWALATGSWPALLLTAAFAVFLDLKARREEAWLSGRFPGYAEYTTRTKRFLPGIY